MINRKKFGAILLAGTMMLGLSTNVFADEIQNPKLEVTKQFELAEGVTVPENATFEFVAEATGDNTANAPTVTIAPISYNAGNPEGSASDGKYSLIKKSDIQISDLKAVGTYTYTLKEKTGSISGMEYSKAEYTLKVDVIRNNDNGKNEIGSVGVANAGGEKVTEIPFVNIYRKNTSLIITKTTTGKGADTEKAFEFKLTLNKAATESAATVTGNIYTGENKGEEKTFTYGKEETFSLKSGQSLRFENLPVGTKYVVKEVGVEGDKYTPSITVKENGTQTTNKTGNEKDDLASADPGKNNMAGEGENKVDFVNAYNYTPVTGIFLNNLPFILLVVLAVGAFGILAAAKRSRNSRKS